MAVIKPKYFDYNPIVITLDALAHSAVYAGRQSDVIDNSTDLYLDAIVRITGMSGASGVTTTGYIEVYAYDSIDGVNFPDTVTGADGAITLTSPPNLHRLGFVNVVAVSTPFKSRSFSVAAAFNGILPQRWGIVVVNKTGGALGTGCAARFRGVQLQSA